MWLQKWIKKKKTDLIAEKGNALFDKNEFEQAIEAWQKGLDILPKPINLQAEAVWFQTAIGDAYFMLEKYEESYTYLFDAKSNLSGEGCINPFIMLRLGQCSLELGKLDAKEYLLRAYLIAGEKIFDDTNEKYFEAIKDEIN